MSRREQLEALKRELVGLQASAGPEKHYAISANVELLEALRSLPTYLNWLTHRLPWLDRERLLEINELLPQYDRVIHEELLRIERDRWPAFIAPLVRRLGAHILAAARPLTVIDLGCGAMEIERQTLLSLHRRRHAYPVTFIGIDASPRALAGARENLASLAHVRIDNVNAADLPRILSTPADGTRILLCCASADALGLLPDQSADLLVHSYFMHHLSTNETRALAEIAHRVARTTLFYDGYRSFVQVLPISLLIWRSPLFLAAFLFSYARFRTRKELVDEHIEGLTFHSGSYLLEV